MERVKAENCIFVGCWYGTKPDMNLFLSVLVQDLLKLDRGLPVNVNGETITLRSRLVGNVFDLPARAAVYCMHGHNGSHGCSWCNSKGQRINKRYCYQ